MASTLASLIAAWLLVIHLLPAARTAARFHPASSALLRAVAVAALASLLLGAFHWPVLLILLPALAGLEAIRVLFPPVSLARFLVDRCAHILVLAALAWHFPDAALHGWWAARLSPDALNRYHASLSCLSGVLLCIPGGGVLIARVIEPFSGQIRDSDLAGLKRRAIAHFLG